MNNPAVLRKFESALPSVRLWIEETLASHKDAAIPVIELGFARLAEHFPQGLLSRAKAVSTTHVPLPPLSGLGVPELSSFERLQSAGITYKDTFFVQESYRTESLCFHELVHVVQWDRLGVDNFLRAYGVGLVQFGYADSPLEQIAYMLQTSFENGIVRGDVIQVINEQTDQFWNQIVPMLQGAGINVGGP